MGRRPKDVDRTRDGGEGVRRGLVAAAATVVVAVEVVIVVFIRKRRVARRYIYSDGISLVEKVSAASHSGTAELPPALSPSL